jgi:hypothetical protein
VIANVILVMPYGEALNKAMPSAQPIEVKFIARAENAAPAEKIERL